MQHTTTPTNTPSQNEQAILNERLERFQADYKRPAKKAKAKALTKRKRREQAAFYIPANVVSMIANSYAPTKANIAFLFELLKRVNYSQSTTAGDIENHFIAPESVRIFAGGRDFPCLDKFYEKKLQSQDLYERDERGLFLKPTQALINKLTAHHALKDTIITKETKR